MYSLGRRRSRSSNDRKGWFLRQPIEGNALMPPHPDSSPYSSSPWVLIQEQERR
jgi:hypothetical protein